MSLTRRTIPEFAYTSVHALAVAAYHAQTAGPVFQLLVVDDAAQ